MKLNPTALTMWAFAGGVGWLIAGTVTGVVTGVVIGLGVSLVSDILFG